MIEIDYVAAMNAMQEAVNEKGADYEYVSPVGRGICVYVDQNNGCPSCLVGYALHKLGVPLVELGRLDHGDIGGSQTIDTAAAELERRGVAKLTEKARMAFLEAQSSQDEGVFWGEALDKAEEIIGKFHEDGTCDCN